jgi:polygalacturonase
MKNYDIKDFGAIGDGLTVNTAPIQTAVDTCAKEGGGKVIVSGGVFVTGTIFMRSNVELYIDSNATLFASSNSDDFPNFTCEEWDVSLAPRATAKCIIYFGFVENASISGMGKIDCNGKHYCTPVYRDGEIVGYDKDITKTPARMIFIMGSTNVRIEDITLTDLAGGWGYWVNNSQFVTFNKAKIYCNQLYPNSDGIHINCCSDVIVDSCIIYSGDDSIVIRANTNTLKENRICERIVIKGCTLSSYCQAVRIAWRNDGTIRNCTLSDLVITKSRVGVVIQLPMYSAPTDFASNATLVENIHFNNIIMDEIGFAPIKVLISDGNLVDGIRNIRFTNVTSNSGDYPLIIGREDALIEEVYFNGCKFTINGNRELPNYTGQFFKHVKGIHLTDTTFDVVGPKKIWKE